MNIYSAKCIELSIGNDQFLVCIGQISTNNSTKNTEHNFKLFRDAHLDNLGISDLLPFNRKHALLHYYTLKHFNLYIIIIVLGKLVHLKQKLSGIEHSRLSIVCKRCY